MKRRSFLTMLGLAPVAAIPMSASAHTDNGDELLAKEASIRATEDVALGQQLASLDRDFERRVIEAARSAKRRRLL